MRLYNHLFCNETALNRFFQEHNLADAGNILIQLFTGVLERPRVQQVLDQIAAALPRAVIIGTSTSGEIMAGTMMSQEIVISCAVFTATSVAACHIGTTSRQSGREVGSRLIGEQTKVLICFSESLRSDPEAFLQGIGMIDRSIVLVGGNAGDNNRFQSTFVIEGNRIHDTGAVVAALSGPALEFSNAYSLNWLPIGREFTVTKARDNLVYEIDHTPIIDMCSRYLGQDTIEALPASIIEFPLVKMVENVPIARSIVAVHPDGAFQYAGNFTEGDKVRFAVGNIEAVLRGASKLREQVAGRPAEAIFIYSCTVRKLFLGEALQTEFAYLDAIAPTAGFFTYGEYYHTGSTNQILNVTSTVLALSESKAIIPHREPSTPHQVSMIKTLTHLVNSTQKELETTISFLDQYKKAVDETSIITKTTPEGIITYVNDRYCTISGFRRDEMLGRHHRDTCFQETAQETFEEMRSTLAKGLSWQGIVKNRSANGESYWADAMIMPLFDPTGKLSEYIDIRHDITRLIKQEQQIKRQTTDDLTALPNRTQLFEDITALASRKNGLLLLDIDNFSVVNELYGIAVGDKILHEVGQRLLKGDDP